MARRRRHYAVPQGVPLPIAVQAPVINLAGIARAYNWVLLDEVIGMRLAVQWYDDAIPKMMFKNPLTIDQQRTMERASKAKMLGDSATIDFEKIQGWRTAIRTYERIFPDRDLPKVDDATAKREAHEQPTADVKNVKTVLDNLNSAFGTFAVKFAPTADAERDLEPAQILIPIEELEALVYAPPLRTVLNEATNVARAKSLTRTPEGKVILDTPTFMAQLPLVLNKVSEWAQSNEKSLIKPIDKAPKIRNVKANMPQVPGQKKQKRVTPRLAGVSVPLSHDPFGVMARNTCGAALAALLYDRQWHRMAELNAICTQYGATNGPIVNLIRKLGAKHTIERNGHSIRVV